MTTQEIRYNINKARLEVEKARRILLNLDNLPEDSVKKYIEDLISAMNIIGHVILELEKGSSRSSRVGSFEDLNRDIRDKMKIEEKLYHTYFYMRNIGYKKIERTRSGIMISNWKSSKTFTKEELKKFLISVEVLISHVTKKAIAG